MASVREEAVEDALRRRAVCRAIGDRVARVRPCRVDAVQEAHQEASKIRLAAMRAFYAPAVVVASPARLVEATGVLADGGTKQANGNGVSLLKRGL